MKPDTADFPFLKKPHLSQTRSVFDSFFPFSLIVLLYSLYRERCLVCFHYLAVSRCGNLGFISIHFDTLGAYSCAVIRAVSC